MPAKPETDFDLNVSKEFLAESIKIEYRNNKKGGPYNKKERIKRQNEVYRLYFEYGYSARKISQMMSVSRGTIDGDIAHLFEDATKKWRFDPIDFIERQIIRLEAQKTRLRIKLDKVETTSEALAIERLILDIETKIMNSYSKMAQTEIASYNKSVKWINEHMKKTNQDKRYISAFDKIRVSEKAREKINKIIKEDRKNLGF